MLARAVTVLLTAFCTAAVSPAEKGAQKPVAARPNAPWLRFPFADLGIPGVSANFLNAGSSLMTVNFIDSSHLLVTFGTRGLVPRIPDDPVTDDDRMVAGEIVELPTGKVLAHTDWHLHDHGRYLWNLGRGRFLLRMGNELSTFSPLDHSTPGARFARVSVGDYKERPSAIFVSPDGAILTVETDVKPARPSSPSPINFSGGSYTEPEPKRISASFYRVDESGDPQNPVKFVPAATVRARSGFVLPADSDGYMWATEKGRDHWNMHFEEFGGKEVSMGELMSSCQPSFTLASRSEFLVLSCRGSEDDLKLSSYGFDGHETWEEPFSTFSGLAFAFAPEAGRFAMSRISSASAGLAGVGGDAGPGPDQEVRIYQTESGDLLLRLHTSPVFRTAENFDLSSDGMEAAVIRNGAVELYRLPELTRHDRDDLAEVQKFAPPTTAAFSIARIAKPINGSGASSARDEDEAPAPSALATARTDSTSPVTASAQPSTSGASPSLAAAPSVNTASGHEAGPTTPAASPSAPAARPATIANGDPAADTETRRAPPTLLKPGEAPENTRKPSTPQ